MCMLIIYPSQTPSNVQLFRFALCKWRVSYEIGGRVGMNGTRCTIRACVPDPSLFVMNIHPPPRRSNTFTHPAETDIVNFTPSGKINGMINGTRHIQRKQTLSTLFQLEVTINTPSSHGHSRLKQNFYRHCQHCFSWK